MACRRTVQSSIIMPCTLTRLFKLFPWGFRPETRYTRTDWTERRPPFQASLWSRRRCKTVGVCLAAQELLCDLPLGVVFLKHELISCLFLQYTITEQCITTTQLNSAGPLPSGAARELRLDVGWGCWVLKGGEGVCSIPAYHCVWLYHHQMRSGRCSIAWW